MTVRVVKMVVGVLTQAYENWRDDRAIRLAAGLAYYALFAIVPLLTTAIAVAGVLFEEAEIRDFLADAAASILVPELKQAFEALAASATISTGGATAISVVAGVVAASFGITALQDTFNLIFDLPVQRGFRFSIRRRGIALLVVFSTGAVLAVSLMVQTISGFIEGLLPGRFDAIGQVNDLLVTGASLALVIASLAALFQLLIRIQLAWRNVMIASAVTSVLLLIGAWALGVYFTTFGSTSLAGVAGAILAFLVFIYYQASIFLAGTELLKTLEQTYPAANS